MLAGNVITHQEQLLKLAYQSVCKRMAEALLMVKLILFSWPESHMPEGRTTKRPNASGQPIANTSLPMILSLEN